MACNKCKQKPANNIKKLTPSIDFEELKTAYDYIQIASKMNDEKWEYVESVYQQLYPGTPPLNKGCNSCLKHRAKVITHHYNQEKNNQ